MRLAALVHLIAWLRSFIGQARRQEVEQARPGIGEVIPDPLSAVLGEPTWAAPVTDAAIPARATGSDPGVGSGHGSMGSMGMIRVEQVQLQSPAYSTHRPYLMDAWSQSLTMHSVLQLAPSWPPLRRRHRGHLRAGCSWEFQVACSPAPQPPRPMCRQLRGTKRARLGKAGCKGVPDLSTKID